MPVGLSNTSVISVAVAVIAGSRNTTAIAITVRKADTSIAKTATSALNAVSAIATATATTNKR